MIFTHITSFSTGDLDWVDNDITPGSSKKVANPTSVAKLWVLYMRNRRALLNNFVPVA